MREIHALCAIVLWSASWLGGEESQVNLRTSGSQANPAVAVDAAGRSVIVWSSYYSSSGRSNEIVARRFDAAGEAVSVDEIQVNMLRAGNQTEPAVAMTETGAYLVAWHGPGVEEEDIFVRLFDPNGLSRTEELLINANTEGEQLYPSVRAGAERYIVVWESRHRDAFGDLRSIRGQLFDGDGGPVGDELRIDEGVYDARYPSVAMAGAGGFVVAWVQDRTTKAILARLYDANGVAMDKPFQVNQIDFGSLTCPSVAMGSSGAFVVVWDGDPNRASDDDIHARCFDHGGAPRGGQFLVNVLEEGAQQWPQVGISDANEFVVVWQHEDPDPNVATDILARRFDGSGVARGDPVRLNGYRVGKQQSPDVAVTRDGAFVAVWESDDQDGSGYGVFARGEAALPAGDADEETAGEIAGED